MLAEKKKKTQKNLSLTQNSSQSVQTLSKLTAEDLKAMIAFGKHVNKSRTIINNNITNTPDNARDFSIWLNSFAEAFSQFAAIYPIASFTDWIGQLIDSDDTRWTPHGFTQNAQFSPDAFYIGLGLTFFLMVGSGYCHSEMQRLTQLKRKNTPNLLQQREDSSKPLSLSTDKIFHLVNDALAHWLGKIGMPIIMISLNIHNNLSLRYTLFILTAILGAIATIPEIVSCYNTLLEIQTLEKSRASNPPAIINDTEIAHSIEAQSTLNTALIPSESKNMAKCIADKVTHMCSQILKTHKDKLNQFSFATQCAVSYLDNQLVFQQIIDNPFIAIPLATLATPAEALGQYALNFNKSHKNTSEGTQPEDVHFCANSNCKIGIKQSTSWTDYNERSIPEKGLLWWRNASLAAACIEAELLLLVLLGTISPEQKQIASACFFMAGLILTRADRRNIATEIKNYNNYNYRNGGRSLLDFNYCKKNTDDTNDKIAQTIII